MIIIVGAGLAGLAAAYKLTQANCRDFLVVEAQDRVGGRIQSIHQPDGCRLDLGAQWLHGERENPVYEWLESLGCIEGPEDDEVEFKGLFATQFGNEAPSSVTSRVLEILLETKKHLYKVSPLLRLDEKCKPIDIFRRSVEDQMSKCPILRSADRGIVQALQRWFELYETIDNSCESLDLLSIKAYREWSDYDDGQMVKLKSGWQAVVDKMVKFIGQDKIRLSSPVRRISYAQGGAHIQLAEGESIKCDQVIVTISLGCLKSLIETDFFEPPLERQRVEGIRSCGFGPVTKVFLEFEGPFLRNEEGLKLLWLRKDESDLAAKEKPLPEWTRFMTGFDLVNGADDCLLAWVGGAGAQELERSSDTEVLETCEELLRRFLPPPLQQSQPKLISITRSRWCTNSFIGGAYSYQSVAALNYDTESLWEPLGNTASGESVLFAGEATAKRMYATAHGAIVSGWEAANKLLTGRK